MEENKNITVAEEAQNDQLTVAYILGQIEKIFADNKHIHEALTKLEGVKSGEMGDIGAQAKAQGIADVVKCRETTNQQLLAFYTRVYTDLTAPKKDPITTRVELIKNLRLSTLKELKGCYCEDELVERADSILCDISSFCNDIFFDRK